MFHEAVAEQTSGSRRGRFKESSLSEVAHDERNRHQRDADADGSEELVDGVGQDKRAGSSCHPGLNHGFAEAQFAQDGRHVHPTVEPRHRNPVRGSQNQHVGWSWNNTVRVTPSRNLN